MKKPSLHPSIRLSSISSHRQPRITPIRITNNTNKDFSTKLLDVSRLPSNPRQRSCAAPYMTMWLRVPKNPEKAALDFGAIDFFNGNTSDGIDQLANGEPLFIPSGQTVRIVLRWELPTEEHRRTH